MTDHEPIQTKKPGTLFLILMILKSMYHRLFRRVAIPVLKTTVFGNRMSKAERLHLPMISREDFHKKNSLVQWAMGLVFRDWFPTDNNTSVFLENYEDRGTCPENQTKRIYFSALTPPLYSAQYQSKVEKFLAQLFDPENEGKPLLEVYTSKYWEFYWEIHLGILPDDIPQNILDVGTLFVGTLAEPLRTDFMKDYKRVRDLHEPLFCWIGSEVDKMLNDMKKGNADKHKSTWVYYWLYNAGLTGGGRAVPEFRTEEVVFEVFHNFIALSQWGNSLYLFAARLKDSQDWKREWEKAFQPNQVIGASGGTFSLQDRFVMEAFRVASPNGGSMSHMEPLRSDSDSTKVIPSGKGGCIHMQERNKGSQEVVQNHITHTHPSNSNDPFNWKTCPMKFAPERYHEHKAASSENPPGSDSVNPKLFPVDPLVTIENAKVKLTNSAFGTVYPEVDGTAHPVYDHVGYAPFGFGYRRCPGELFTIDLFKDLFQYLADHRIEFVNYTGGGIKPVRIAPGTVYNDNITFKTVKS